jgi:hypothetical protein
VRTSSRAAAAATLVEPEFEPGIAELRFYPNVIESLFPSVPVNGGVVSYVKQTGMTNNAAATPEGATKPTSSVAVARYSDTIGKITNLERVTDETIEDAPQFWALVQQDGVLGVSASSRSNCLQALACRVSSVCSTATHRLLVCRTRRDSLQPTVVTP